METINNKINGRWRVNSTIGFTADGKRITKCKYYKENPYSAETTNLHSCKTSTKIENPHNVNRK